MQLVNTQPFVLGALLMLVTLLGFLSNLPHIGISKEKFKAGFNDSTILFAIYIVVILGIAMKAVLHDGVLAGVVLFTSLVYSLTHLKRFMPKRLTLWYLLIQFFVSVPVWVIFIGWGFGVINVG